MSLTTLLIPLLIAIVWILIWAARGVARQFKLRQPVGAKYSMVLLGSSASLAFVWCFGLYVWASLGQSPHPLADVWLECLAGVVIFFILRIAFLAWCRYRIGKEMSGNVKRERIRI